MDNGIRISADAMSRQERKYDMVAHNAANVATDYFKEVLLSYESDNKGNITQVNSYSPEQGALKNNSDNLSFALSDKNFIKASDSDGNLFYLKTGKLSVSADGSLMSGDYHILDDNSRPIVITSAADFYVNESGYISEAGVQTGRMGIVSLDKASKLVQINSGVFSSQGVAETDPGQGALIKQGFAEASNVNTTRQVTNMIAVMHTYEASQKALIANDESVNKAISEVGKF